MVLIERCDDEGCPGFGEQHVDRGYGYTVCPANALNPNLKPMDERYIGQFAGELLAKKEDEHANMDNKTIR